MLPHCQHLLTRKVLLCHYLFMKKRTDLDIAELLTDNEGNVSAVARITGLNRSGIHKRMKSDDIEIVKLPVDGETAVKVRRNPKKAIKALEGMEDEQ